MGHKEVFQEHVRNFFISDKFEDLDLRTGNLGKRNEMTQRNRGLAIVMVTMALAPEVVAIQSSSIFTRVFDHVLDECKNTDPESRIKRPILWDRMDKLRSDVSDLQTTVQSGIEIVGPPVPIWLETICGELAVLEANADSFVTPLKDEEERKEKERLERWNSLTAPEQQIEIDERASRAQAWAKHATGI